ncbi:MAG: tetratricopeptide repeat protein [Clostridia bacterium]
MKNIVIFLAAGEESLESERIEITRLVQNLNQIYKRKAKNIKLKLFKTGTDAEFTKENFENSEMMFLISCDELNIQDLECFHSAFERFQVNDTPRIATYFKKSETKTQEVIDFMNDLDKNNKHYYSEFISISELNNKILLNLISLEDNPKLEYIDNKILFEGEEIGTLEGLNCILKNKLLQKLKGDLDELKQQHLAAVVKNIEKSTQENRLEVMRLQNETQKMQETIENLESSILNAMLDLAKMSTKSNLQPMQIQAYKYLEQGEYEKADAILDFEQIKHNIAHTGKQLSTAEETVDQLRKNQVSNVEAILTKIKTTIMCVEIADRFERIEEFYETAMQTEKEYKLDPKAICEYASYLYDQNKFRESIEVSNWLLWYYQNNDDKRADIFNLLGRCYYIQNSFAKAKQMYNQALEILKRLSSENSSHFTPNLAINYYNIANLHRKTKNYIESENMYKKAIKIFESLAIENSTAYQSDLAMSYNSLAILYVDTKKYEKAIYMYNQALETRKILANENINSFKADLADTYNNLAILYKNSQRHIESEYMYKQALALYEKLASENPAAFEPNLATNYYNLANLYSNTKRYTQAEQKYNKSIEIFKRLASQNLAAFEPNLSISYNSLAKLCCDTQRYIEAEELYLIALEIRKRLALENATAFEPNLATSYNNLAILYYNTKRYIESEQMYKLALEIRERLNKKNPTAFKSNLANTYNNLAVLYDEIQRYEEAEQMYKKLVELQSKT